MSGSRRDESEPAPVETETEPGSVSTERGRLLAFAQANEGFDVTGIQFYETMVQENNGAGLYIAEVLVLALRMSRWAIGGTRPDWGTFSEDYSPDELFPQNRILKPPSMNEKMWGADLIGVALAHIIGWKVWNFPDLSNDAVASSDVFDNLSQGAKQFIRPDNPFHATFKFEPTLGRILDGLRYRLMVETDNLYETIYAVTDSESETDHLPIEYVSPEAGYGDSLAQVVEWYTSLEHPLQIIGDAMQPTTPESSVAKISKQEFMKRLAPALGRTSTLPGLPLYEQVLGPLAYGQSIVLGDLIMKVREDTLPAFSYRLIRNQSIPFEVIDTQDATKEEVLLTPLDLYASMIGYIVGTMTPSDPGASAVEMAAFMGLGAATLLSKLEIAAFSRKSEEAGGITTGPKYEIGDSANYINLPVRILEYKLFVYETNRVHKYRVKSTTGVYLDQKYWISENLLTPLASDMERTKPPEKDLTDWERDIWYQIRHADRPTAEVLYHILDKGP